MSQGVFRALEGKVILECMLPAVVVKSAPDQVMYLIHFLLFHSEKNIVLNSLG